eukprot:scaffold295507_cov33-Tisochrysis_lutea.AAC.1
MSRSRLLPVHLPLVNSLHRVSAKIMSSDSLGVADDDDDEHVGGRPVPKAEDDDDDDDDEGVDLSAYAVGELSEGSEGASPPHESSSHRSFSPSYRSFSPASSEWDDEDLPEAGEMVRARFSERSATVRRAQVLAMDARARCLAVRFEGWGDVVHVPFRQVEMVEGRSPRVKKKRRGAVDEAHPARHPGRASPTYDDFHCGGAEDERMHADAGRAQHTRSSSMSAQGEDLSPEERRLIQEFKRTRDEAGSSSDCLEDDRGRRLLQRMGWEPGTALGSSFGNSERPVAEVMHSQHDRRGLGSRGR